MDEADRLELEKYRSKKKQRMEYNNNFLKEHYKRVTCLFPLDKVEPLEQAASDSGMKVSTYIMSLVYADLKERGLI